MNLKETCSDWTSQTPQCIAFVTLLLESNTALGGMLGK